MLHYGGLLCLWLVLALPCQTMAAGCGPTYGADGIATDGKGGVWFTHFEDSRIGRVFPESGEFQEYLASAKANPVVATQKGRIKKDEFDYSKDNGFTGIALDVENGFLWAVRFGSNRLARFSLKDASFKEFKFRTQLFHTRGRLPMTADGSLWLLTAKPAANGLEKGVLTRLSAGGKITSELALPAGAFVSPVVAVDGSGKPWVALTPAGGKHATLHTLDKGRWRQLDIHDAGRYVTGMVFDRQDSLWLAAPERNAVARYASGKVTLYTAPVANSYPQQVFAGPEDSIWFTEWNSHRIGRLSGAGQINEYALPPEEESPLTLAFAKDGTVWFSALFNYNLFQLDPATGRISEYTIPPPANWFGDAKGNSYSCTVSSRGRLQELFMLLP